MNAVFELVEEPDDDEVKKKPIVEVLTDEQVTALADPESLKHQLEVAKERFVVLRPTDALSAKRCAALAATCTFASRHAEDQRTAITDPLNKQVKDANLIWQPIVKGFEELGRAMKTAVAKWIDDERKAAQREQQRLIDEANEKQRLLDEKAKAERDEAERLRVEADKAATVEEAEVLHQQADKLEKKADKDELKASQVVTTIAPMQSKTLDLGTSSLTTKTPKNTWLLPGYDKQKPLKLTDHILATVVGDLSTLPAGVLFLLKHADLNPVYLNKSFGVIEFPAPFAVVPDYSGASVRGK
jgi:hypothetical protein